MSAWGLYGAVVAVVVLFASHSMHTLACTTLPPRLTAPYHQPFSTLCHHSSLSPSPLFPRLAAVWHRPQCNGGVEKKNKGRREQCIRRDGGSLTSELKPGGCVCVYLCFVGGGCGFHTPSHALAVAASTAVPKKLVKFSWIEAMMTSMY
eukprot:Sspe_Gene.81071::Locus_51607_Transcript_1_1_Confidence_1.000_Length_658::g.81071::m.81071